MKKDNYINLPGSEFIKTDQFRKMLRDYDLRVDQFTCNNCLDKETCEYSYDPYNIDGDCLACK